MTKELTDFLEFDGEKLPLVSTKEDLEKSGARYFKSDKFIVDGTEIVIEYLIIERDYAIVWKKFNEGDENYQLHLVAPQIVRFSNLKP